MSFIEYPSPTPVFPSLPVQGFPVKKSATFGAWEHRSVSGRQYQTARQAYPNWLFELTYAGDSWMREQTQNIAPYEPNVPKVEFETLSQLFLSCYGNYGEFYYDDPTDDSRTGQLIGRGDASTTVWRIVRTWGTTLGRFEPVGGVNLLAPNWVYLNGVQQFTGYSVTNDPDGSHLTFTVSPPANGVVITMDFSFYYRCRWQEAMQQYDQFMYNLWQSGKVAFRSVKP